MKQTVEVNFRFFERDATGFDFRHVENVVDQIQQVLAAADDDVERLLLLRRHVQSRF